MNEENEVSRIVDKIKKTMMDYIIEVSGLLKELVECKGIKREEKGNKKNTQNKADHKKKQKKPMPPHLYYRKIFYPKLKERLGDDKEQINKLINENWNELTPEQKNTWKVKAVEYREKQQNEEKKVERKQVKDFDLLKSEVEVLFLQEQNQEKKEKEEEPSSPGEEESGDESNQNGEESEGDSIQRDEANYNFHLKMDPFSKLDPEFQKSIEERRKKREEENKLKQSKGSQKKEENPEKKKEEQEKKEDKSAAQVKKELEKSPTLLKVRKSEEESRSPVEPSTEKKKKKKKKKHKHQE